MIHARRRRPEPRYLAPCALAAAIVAMAPAHATLEPVAWAGWSSGGGEVSLDTDNPWFLSNVTEVRACLSIDERGMGVDASAARASVERAWAFWRNSFASAPGEDHGVASQPLVWEEGCDGRVDLAFHFGTLPDGAAGRMPDPERTVARTVRTRYDSRTLRGGGFIYVAPGRGPLAPSRAAADTERWRYAGGVLLDLVLRHELGHVFGIPHKSAKPGDLMHTAFVEDLVAPSNARIVAGYFLRSSEEWVRELSPLAGPRGKCLTRGAPPAALARYWGLTPNATAYSVVVRGGRLRVLESLGADPELEDDRMTPVGEVRLERLVDEAQALASIFLTNAQAVFPLRRGGRDPFLYYAFAPAGIWWGTYQSRGGVTRVVHVNAGGSELSVTGVLDGKPVSSLLCGLAGVDGTPPGPDR